MSALSRERAETYASWFRCMADPTRLQVLHVLASEKRPMRVGEIAQTIGLAQSTISVHLQRLLDDEFVLLDRSGTSSWYIVNAACIEQFPRAAEQVMGSLAGKIPAHELPTTAPWAGSDDDQR
ncbi:ArsR/SmtB family transcription factor [Rathayibacter soli]|uniref:ArsR/SmtB family transcription factor n=1 Tax=Rathayibacter soli TaxID=3144168 RepID=UPI0027E4EAB3|nr:metalloregulator ArsR/SmtB family transcription factor [Glaciibacter superstes]